MGLDERAFFTEKSETRPGSYQCPKCRRTSEYSVRWVRRTKKDRLPPNADDADRAKFAKLRESEIPDYADKAERERKSWEKLFRTQILEKLRNALFEVETTRTLLNGYLKRPIGTNRMLFSMSVCSSFRRYSLSSIISVAIS